jgi:hypothetical protein
MDLILYPNIVSFCEHDKEISDYMSNWSERLTEINLNSGFSQLVSKVKVGTSQLRYSKEIIIEWYL